MQHHVTLNCPVNDSFRVRQVAGMFDLPLAARLEEHFSVELPELNDSWQIGLIVGPSGSGKSSIAREVFEDSLYTPGDWPVERAVIDCFGERPTREITQMLTAVGLSSPPAWVKPYHVLSGGERFRCDLARALLADRPLVVFDEFTSVVDRTAAKCGAAAVSKALRSGQRRKKLIAVTCHYDVAEWLSPDWVLDMGSGQLARGCLRRPQIKLEVFRCGYQAWSAFGRHHYLSRTVNRGSHCYLATWHEEPVAFCALLALPGRRGAWRISRLVVLPDFQGLGIGGAVARTIAELYRATDRTVSITTSHPAMIAGLRHSPHWELRAVKKTGYRMQSGAKRGAITGYINNTSRGRAVVSFQYRGQNTRKGDCDGQVSAKQNTQPENS
jgi:ABC-type polar amino acid transport system ATPase subunit